MKSKKIKKLLAIILCILLLTASFPFTAFAGETENTVSMVEGDVISQFVSPEAVCESDDPSVAWVDDDGCLKALKCGSASVTVTEENEQTVYNVTVSDYTDGSDIVGNLKILARYNDSMQFYDGHVYLLFTSYQDDITISVPDLYGGYAISDNYYDDIRESISNGSNHTGSDPDKYFTFSDEMTSVTLNRGEIVTIGMYRGFDLSVPQAALGSIKNSSAWDDLVTAGKSAVIETLIRAVETRLITVDGAIEKIKAVFDEVGVDYNKALDGVVEGGLCFNRELYNQKLEWDQYENVTYDLDITRNQLSIMNMYLGGNLNKFSILKNSCATVALRGWNATVGVRNGEDTAYKLSSQGEGIFSIIDAPKGVRDSIVSNLPGYCLNNSDFVEEEGAGYEDETGWVYVSAPKYVTPSVYVYNGDDLVIDESKTTITSLMKAAKGDKIISYNKDDQEIGINFEKRIDGDNAVIDCIDFDINGEILHFNEDTMYDGRIWLKAKVDPVVEGEHYYVTDQNGEALSSVYQDGSVSFCVDSVPFSYSIVGSTQGSRNILDIEIINKEESGARTLVYMESGDEDTMLVSPAEVAEGSKVYVKAFLDKDDDKYILSDININGLNIIDDEHYDENENAYFFIMPEAYSILTVVYSEAEVVYTDETQNDAFLIQAFVGDTLNVNDYAKLKVGGSLVDEGDIVWEVFLDENDALEADDAQLKVNKEGKTLVRACAAGNRNIFTYFAVYAYESRENMIKLTFDSETAERVLFNTVKDDEVSAVFSSGFYAEKGSELTVDVKAEYDSMAVLYISVNGTNVGKDDKIILTEDTDVKVRLVNASISGLPEKIELSSKGDTYQLDAKLSYDGLYSLLPVFDNTLVYESFDELVSVDDNGLITAAGDIPEDGKCVLIKVSSLKYNGITSNCKVIVGNYSGSRIVGNLTISARRISENELIAHGAATFTPYEDMDLDISYYNYYKPNDKYNSLMLDYEKNPEKYTSDPALYTDNELGLEERESYFDADASGPHSQPKAVSLKAGESISMSNYGYDPSVITVKKALEGDISSYLPTEIFLQQIDTYLQGNEIDSPLVFDTLVATIVYMYQYKAAVGVNPANGESDGGLDINREIYNQFRRSDTQFPNNYYSIDITEDELNSMIDYLSDPDNNFYSLLTQNCATGAVNIWNAAMFDKDELQIKADFTGLATDPESLYFVLGLMRLKNLEGRGGTDFYPRTAAYTDALNDAVAKIDSIGEVVLSDECKEKIEEARKAVDALSDAELLRLRNLDTLLEAEELYSKLEKAGLAEEFEEYKNEIIEKADALLNEDDDFVSSLMVEFAKAAVKAASYDADKTLEENTAQLEEVLVTLAKALEDRRKSEESAPLLGDADGDGQVSIADATTIQMKLAMMDVPVFVEKAADVDGDGQITIADATALQMWLAQITESDKIGRPVR